MPHREHPHHHSKQLNTWIILMLSGRIISIREQVQRHLGISDRDVNLPWNHRNLHQNIDSWDSSKKSKEMYSPLAPLTIGASVLGHCTWATHSDTHRLTLNRAICFPFFKMVISVFYCIFQKISLFSNIRIKNRIFSKTSVWLSTVTVHWQTIHLHHM